MENPCDVCGEVHMTGCGEHREAERLVGEKHEAIEEITRLREEIESLTHENERLINDNRRLREMGYGTEVVPLRAEIKRLRLEVDKATSTLEGLRSKNESLQEELEKCRCEHVEWICEECEHVAPPKWDGVRCVICPNCGETAFMHKHLWERRKIEKQRDRAEELLRSIVQWSDAVWEDHPAEGDVMKGRAYLSKREGE